MPRVDICTTYVIMVNEAYSGDKRTEEKYAASQVALTTVYKGQMAKRMSGPACSAPLTIKHRFVKLVTCDFCGQVSLVHATGLDPTGRTAKLAQLPSPLYVDATGQLEGRRFRVIGRLRYRYASGMWDEWFLTFENDRPGWLVEDEGEYTFYVKETVRGYVPPFESVSVGSVATIAGRQVFVTEKGEAFIDGGEGQLAFTILPGEAAQKNQRDGCWAMLSRQIRATRKPGCGYPASPKRQRSAPIACSEYWRSIQVIVGHQSSWQPCRQSKQKHLRLPLLLARCLQSQPRNSNSTCSSAPSRAFG